MEWAHWNEGGLSEMMEGLEEMREGSLVWWRAHWNDGGPSGARDGSAEWGRAQWNEGGLSGIMERSVNEGGFSGMREGSVEWGRTRWNGVDQQMVPIQDAWPRQYHYSSIRPLTFFGNLPWSLVFRVSRGQAVLLAVREVDKFRPVRDWERAGKQTWRRVGSGQGSWPDMRWYRNGQADVMWGCW